MLSKLLMWALLLVGSAGLLQVNYLQLKASVAQRLIANSWQQQQQAGPLGDGQAIKPWAWADFNAIARLRWQQQDLYVMSSASGQALAFGPGHMSQTTAPGRHGQVIIAGHNDSHFGFLEQLQIDDELSLEDAQGKQKTYKISSVSVLDSRVSQLQHSTDDELLLVTCYPFHSLDRNTPLRLVVRATAQPDIDTRHNRTAT